MTTFKQLNLGWNAEPNAPNPQIRGDGDIIVVTFSLNSFQFPEFDCDDIGRLSFLSCSRYRLGPTNDEGWYRGQCRFSGIAPSWGEFYEVVGDLRLAHCEYPWTKLESSSEPKRHFLFYFRDQTFECDAGEWKFEVLKAKTNGVG